MPGWTACSQFRIPDAEYPWVETYESAADCGPSLSYRETQFHQVKTLGDQGLSLREIAKQVGLDRRVVKKYLQVEKYEQVRPMRSHRSELLPYLDALQERWQAGERNIKRLWLDLYPS